MKIVLDKGECIAYNITVKAIAINLVCMALA